MFSIKWCLRPRKYLRYRELLMLFFKLKKNLVASVGTTSAQYLIRHNALKMDEIRVYLFPRMFRVWIVRMLSLVQLVRPKFVFVIKLYYF